MPVSVTLTRAVWPSPSTAIEMLPPAGVYLIAFQSRFMTICSMRDWSPSTQVASALTSS